jgi:hypothetical protein
MRRQSLIRLLAPTLAAVALVGIAPVLPAVGHGPVKVVGREVTTSLDRTTLVELPLTASHVAFYWPGTRHVHLSIALSSDGTTFDAPFVTEPGDQGRGRIDSTYTGVIWADGARFVRIVSDLPLPQLTVVAIDSRGLNGSLSLGGNGSYAATAAVTQPSVITRAGWGADESLRFRNGQEYWPRTYSPVQKLIVHHTAGKNNDPDPAATVRAIYYLDAVTRDWGDMGYNFLIDEAGRIYEGRYARAYASGEIPTGEDTSGRLVTGAHVLGYNVGTVGIVLLGTLTKQDATPAARATLEKLLAWEADRHGLNPLGTSLYTNPVSGAQKTTANISGHRDWSATECPGGTFYATFPSLRQAVASRISAGTTQTVPSAPVLAASTPKAGKGVQLSWSAPADGGSPITEYRVLRLNGGSFVLIATVKANTRTYSDKGTKRGFSYTYTVRAVNAIGVGPASNQATATAR